MANASRLAERRHGAEEDSEVLLVARACVDELMVEHALLMEGSELARAEPDTLPTRIR